MAKKVTKKYALNEFVTIGLVLVLYSLYVLYVPLVLDYLFELIDLGTIFNLNIEHLIKTGLLVIGTILPFSLLKAANRKFGKKQVKIRASFKEIACESLVFFSLTSVSIFAMTSIASYFNISGQLVSGIGISIDSSYMEDIVYLVTFIIISPIIEEFAFRGVLLDTLSKYGKYFALIATSVVYALAHGSFLEFIPSFIMSIILCKIKLRYKSTTPTIRIHIIFNAILVGLFLIPEEYSLYSAIVLTLIYVISLLLYVTKAYRHIVIKKNAQSDKVLMMFLTNTTIVFSLMLFIIHSFISLLLK